MDKTPEQLESEVREQRADVEHTIDALRAKMSIGQMVDELSGRMGGGEAKAFFANAGRQVRDNPLALGLIGAGFAWLAAGDGVRRSAGDAYDRYSDDDRDGLPRYPGAMSGRSDVRGYGAGYSGPKSAFADDDYDAGYAGSDKDDGEGIGDRVSSAYESAKDSASSAAESVSGAIAGGRDRARDAGRRARGAGERARSGAGYRAERAQDTFLRTLEEQPLVLGALAMAVGTAIGAALPSTRTEDELMGEHRDRLRDDAAEYLERKGAEGAEAAEKAYDSVKDEAKKKADEATGKSHAEAVSSSSDTEHERTS